MKNPSVRSIMQRTGALLMVPVLCVSALAVNANAESQADNRSPVQQEQQAAPEAGKETKPNNRNVKTEKKVPGKKDGPGKKSTTEKPNNESETEKDPASDMVSTEILQLHPGDSVTFSAILENSMDSKSSADKDSEMNAALSVEIVSEVNKITDEKSTKKDKSAEKDAGVQQRSKDDKTMDSAKETDNTENSDSTAYSWQVDRKKGKGWQDLKNATGSSYQIKKVTKWQNGWEYRCVISRAELTIESSSVQLQVDKAADTAKPSDTAEPTEVTQHSDSVKASDNNIIGA